MTTTEPQVNTNYLTTPLSHDEVTTILDDWVREYPPSRFAILGIFDDQEIGGYDGDILAWGLAFDDHVTVQSANQQLTGRFHSPESMLRALFRRHRDDVRLIWIDPEPTPPEE